MIIAALSIIGPLAAAILTIVLRRYPRELALSGGAVALVASLVTLARVDNGARFAATLPGLPEWPMRLVVDPLSAVFMTTVSTVGLFVLIYAVGYMEGEDGQDRFFSSMAFFITAMQVLVLAGDWILLLTAWELIGFASYLLIGFWYERSGVAAAATQAFLVTRAADLGLYIGAFILIIDTGTSSIAAAADVGTTTGTLAGLAFLLAVIGKSAQVPLQGWLQDAMVGPTPVSALLHAATLVVAGVVLLARAFPLLPGAVLLVVGLVGGISAVASGLIAFAQKDLKRLLASSTSSQLGLMLLAIGAGSVPAAVFHLVTQAAMKSTLFLAAGVFQHERESTAFDDLRGIGRQRPGTFAAFVVAGLALSGVPPLAGFWSKDSILAATMHAGTANVLAPLAVVGSALTGLYIGRACRLLWQGDIEASDTVGLSRAMIWMGAGMGVLAILASALSLAVDPYARLIGAELPESVAALVTGLLAAAIGLLLGWAVPAARLLGHTREMFRGGLRIRDGWMTFAVQPAMLLARWTDSSDIAIHEGVLRMGRLVLGMAFRCLSADEMLNDVVRAVGYGSMAVARATWTLDTDGIDGLIQRLVNGVRRLGQHSRALQSGLVHRELLLAFGGTAAILVLALVLII